MEPKQLPMEELKQCYVIDPKAPSGLSRIGSPGRRKGRLGHTGGPDSEGYWRVTHLGSSYRINRIVWALHYGRDPGQLLIDHRDGNRANNLIDNLRACTCAQNLQNKKSPGRSSGQDLPKGVTKRGNIYEVSIMVEGHRYQDKFQSIEAAAIGARLLRVAHHGEYARHD